MTSKTNKILLGVLVVQIGVFAAVNMMRRDEPIANKPLKLFDGVSAEKIDSITITDENKKSVEIKRQGANWVLASGGDFPVKKEKADEFVGKLIGLSSSEIVSENPGHHHALEVSQEKFRRKILFHAGETQYQALWGSSPGFKTLHVRLGDEKGVHLVHDINTSDASTIASDWVATELFKVEDEKLVEFRLKSAEGEIHLVKENDIWKAVNNPLELEQSEVKTLFSSNNTFTLREPVGKTVEEKFGLSNPTLTLTFVVEEKTPTEKKEGEQSATDASAPVVAERKTFTLTVGAKVDSDYYAKASTNDYVVKIGNWAVDNLSKKKLSDLKRKENKSQAPAPPLHTPPG